MKNKALSEREIKRLIESGQIVKLNLYLYKEGSSAELEKKLLDHKEVNIMHEKRSANVQFYNKGNEKFEKRSSTNFNLLLDQENTKQEVCEDCFNPYKKFKKRDTRPSLKDRTILNPRSKDKHLTIKYNHETCTQFMI